MVGVCGPTPLAGLGLPLVLVLLLGTHFVPNPARSGVDRGRGQWSARPLTGHRLKGLVPAPTFNKNEVGDTLDPAKAGRRLAFRATPGNESKGVCGGKETGEGLLTEGPGL